MHFKTQAIVKGNRNSNRIVLQGASIYQAAQIVEMDLNSGIAVHDTVHCGYDPVY